MLRSSKWVLRLLLFGSTEQRPQELPSFQPSDFSTRSRLILLKELNCSVTEETWGTDPYRSVSLVLHLYTCSVFMVMQLGSCEWVRWLISVDGDLQHLPEGGAGGGDGDVWWHWGFCCSVLTSCCPAGLPQNMWWCLSRRERDVDAPKDISKLSKKVKSLLNFSFLLSTTPFLWFPLWTDLGLVGGGAALLTTLLTEIFLYSVQVRKKSSLWAEDLFPPDRKECFSAVVQWTAHYWEDIPECVHRFSLTLINRHSLNTDVLIRFSRKCKFLTATTLN